MSLKEYVKKIFCYLFRFFPIDNQKFIFNNYFGRGYGCNPKYVAEALHKLYPKGKFIWVLKKGIESKDIPDFITTVPLGGLRFIYEYATAKVWVSNVRQMLYLSKRKSQLYIQTWHGAIGIKKCEGDASDKIDPHFKKMSERDSLQTDYCISNSRFCTDFYKRAFWFDYPEKILEIGYPRNDVVVNNPKEIYSKVRSHFSLNSEVKIFFYAPTFRKTDDSSKAITELDVELIRKTFQEKFGGEWVCVLRLHPWAISRLKGAFAFNDKIIDGSMYEDIQELLVASDSMITDYSSCLFDFALSKKPSFMFATDIQSYIHERGLLFDPYKLPMSCAESNEMLVSQIRNFDKNSYKKRIDDFYKELGIQEFGKASYIVAKKIQEIIK